MVLKQKKFFLINQILNEKFKIFSPKKINRKIKLVYFGSLRKNEKCKFYYSNFFQN